MSESDPKNRLFGKYQELVLLLLGFVFTTVAGSLIGDSLQQKSFEHQHQVQRCDLDRVAGTKAYQDLAALMDKRLLKLRLLAWQMESSHSLVDITKEREGNKQARDEWSSQINNQLHSIQYYFGTDARSELEGPIAEGLTNLQKEANDLVKAGHFTKDEAQKFEADIDAFNPTVYQFDQMLMKAIEEDHIGKCNTTK